MADQQPLHGSVVVRLQRDLFMKRTFIHNLKTKAAWLEKWKNVGSFLLLHNNLQYF